MKQRPTRPHKLGEFMEGKGYYIVLFLCIAAIGISGYFLFRGLFAQPEGFGETSTAAVSGQAKLDRETGESRPPRPPRPRQLPPRNRQRRSRRKRLLPRPRKRRTFRRRRLRNLPPTSGR